MHCYLITPTLPEVAFLGQLFPVHDRLVPGRASRIRRILGD